MAVFLLKLSFMASVPRSAILEDDSIFHVTWQCHNHEWLLEQVWAKETYYELLLKYKNRYQIEIYSYCFMDNHPHLTGRFKSLKLFSDFFRVVNSVFAKKYNKKMKRKGQVVMDRFRSIRIDKDQALLKVMFYIDLNPKRAGKVSHPYKNSFSSYLYYANGKPDPLITPAPSYLLLGADLQERQRVYTEMVEQILKDDWKKKEPYSSIPYIGDPTWVTLRVAQLNQIRSEKFKYWKDAFRKKFS